MKRQREQAEVMWSCYESGPFGYGLHRQLEALGVKNLVVCAQSWDELSTGVKTDKSDAPHAPAHRSAGTQPTAGPVPAGRGTLVATGRLAATEWLAAWLTGGVAGAAARVYFKGVPENGAPDPNGGRGRQGISTGWVEISGLNHFENTP